MLFYFFLGMLVDNIEGSSCDRIEVSLKGAISFSIFGTGIYERQLNGTINGRAWYKETGSSYYANTFKYDNDTSNWRVSSLYFYTMFIYIRTNLIYI